MNEPIETINIPSKQREPTAQDRIYADGLINIMRKVGMDPRKAAHNPMAIACAGSWRRGESTQGELERMFRNLLLFNPGLKA